MSLVKDNFVIKAIFVDINNKITEQDVSQNMEGFTNTNSASILGNDTLKYKMMFNNIVIPENTKYITFQVSILKDNKYYNPYLCLPILNNNGSRTFDGPGRAITFKIHNNTFNYVWFYLTIDSVNQILNHFQPEDDMTNMIQYMKEYMNEL